jgi:hypothetical protein
MGATITSAEIKAVTDSPGALRFVQRTGSVHIFQCVAHNHGDHPQFWATRQFVPALFGPAATIAAAITLAERATVAS